MVTIAIIISIIALAGAGFAFIRASSSHHILGKRIEDLKERIKYLEASQNRGQSVSGKGNKPTIEQSETGRRNQPRHEQQEARQSQPREERQDARQNQPREERQEQRQKQRQKQRERQLPASEELQGSDETQVQPQPQQPRRKKENRRRNEPMERNTEETGREQQMASPKDVKLEFSDSDFLAELEQSASNVPTETVPEVVADSGIRFAIIPEDGVIRQHQLQQRPDSDSYIEIDVPTEGSSQTRYRFNLGGNHAFVISQGIDRLENAFDFEKPSNRMVTKVVQQQDGVLSKVNNGWRIQEKARIDFR